jgi:hypothetical protein
VDCVDDRLVITPFVGLVWSYGGEFTARASRWGLEAGPGVSLRKWFREDKYNAPQSSVDLAVQYRWGLSNDRDDILWLQFSLNY